MGSLFKHTQAVHGGRLSMLIDAREASGSQWEGDCRCSASLAPHNGTSTIVATLSSFAANDRSNDIDRRYVFDAHLARSGGTMVGVIH